MLIRFTSQLMWTVSGGRFEVAPETLGGDAVSVSYLDEWLPSYFEIQATINAGKPTGGDKSNAFMIFDYQSPTDFKYAGINISSSKLEMGYRDESGWHELAEGTVKGRLWYDRNYDVLLAVNGTVATLLVDNKEVFTYVFESRVIDGLSYGPNRGMVGIGALNSKARIDNVKAQILPPEVTHEETGDFTDGTADSFLVQSGDWRVGKKRYGGDPDDRHRRDLHVGEG